MRNWNLPHPAAVLVAAAAFAAALSVGSNFAGASYVYTPRSNTPLNMPNCYRNARVTRACENDALRNFDVARAKERLGRMVLPSNFRSLPIQDQLLVLVNTERMDRGLRPFVGLSTALDSIALTGARTTRDPAFPTWARTLNMQGGSIFATNTNPLIDEFLWMYDDGYGGALTWNGDCSTATSSGCWAHRHAELKETLTPLIAGAGWTAAATSGANRGHPALAAIFLGRDTHDSANAWKWSWEVPYFPLGSPEHPRA